jgi:hypothetical protein
MNDSSFDDMIWSYRYAADPKIMLECLMDYFPPDIIDRRDELWTRVVPFIEDRELYSFTILKSDQNIYVRVPKEVFKYHSTEYYSKKYGVLNQESEKRQSDISEEDFKIILKQILARTGLRQEWIIDNNEINQEGPKYYVDVEFIGERLRNDDDKILCANIYQAFIDLFLAKLDKLLQGASELRMASYQTLLIHFSNWVLEKLEKEHEPIKIEIWKRLQTIPKIMGVKGEKPKSQYSGPSGFGLRDRISGHKVMELYNGLLKSFITFDFKPLIIGEYNTFLQILHEENLKTYLKKNPKDCIIWNGENKFFFYFFDKLKALMPESVRPGALTLVKESGCFRDKTPQKSPMDSQGKHRKPPGEKPITSTEKKFFDDLFNQIAPRP